MFSRTFSTFNLATMKLTMKMKMQNGKNAIIEEFKNPSFKLNAVVGMVVFGIGDLVAQSFETKSPTINSSTPISTTDSTSSSSYLSNQQIHHLHSNINATSSNSSTTLRSPLFYSTAFYENYNKFLTLDHSLSMKVSLLG